MGDSELERLRAEITALDRDIFASLNRRLQLVSDLKRYKDERGIAFVDPGREAALIEARVRENRGPLSDDGLRAFYVELLALVKREV